MTYGNAYFLRWLRLCCAVVAAFFALSAQGQQVTASTRDGKGRTYGVRVSITGIEDSVKNGSPARRIRYSWSTQVTEDAKSVDGFVAGNRVAGWGGSFGPNLVNAGSGYTDLLPFEWLTESGTGRKYQGVYAQA